MAQDSWVYGCGVGDARALSAEDWHTFNTAMFIQDDTIHGVIYTSGTILGGLYAGRLNATNPAGNTVRIASGLALIKGVFYTNNANVDFDVTGPGGGAQTDLIVLRWTIAANTVRLAHKTGVVGGAAATVQQDAAIWEIVIAEVFKAAGTNITTLTPYGSYYANPFLHFNTRISSTNIDDNSITTAKINNLAVTTGKIADSAVTAIKIADRTRTFFVSAQTALNFTDGLTVIRSESGVLMLDNKVVTAYGSFIVPKDFSSGLTVTPVVVPAASGNIYNYFELNYGKINEAYNLTTDTVAYHADAVTINLNSPCTAIAASAEEIDDIVKISFFRDSTNALDTVGASVYLDGWIVSYTADS